MPAFAIARNSKVTALTRRDAGEARASAAQYGIPYSFTSTEELARCEEVDAVFIATPDALHLRDVLAVMRIGKPALCEKPMAMNAVEVEEMIAAAKAAGQLLAVAHVFASRRARGRCAIALPQTRSAYRHLLAPNSVTPPSRVRGRGSRIRNWLPAARSPMLVCTASTRCDSSWTMRYSP